MKQNENFFVWKIINILSLRASWNELKMKKLLQCVKNKIYCCFLSNLNLYIFILSPVVYAVFCQSLLCITKKEPEWDINMVLLLFLVIVLSMTHKCAWHIFDLWNMHDYTFFILEKLNCCAKLVTPHTANSVECTAYNPKLSKNKFRQNKTQKWNEEALIFAINLTTLLCTHRIVYLYCIYQNLRYTESSLQNSSILSFIG